MELPKNITQIGETNPHCKIYVEDYVISYIRQLNQYAREKGLAV
ncbi:MAG: peptidoglycan-binding protein, partial [Lachnospiraceae bacterium]|nr:peptidoglycan-binding protein [Lachnospiraceae bacterium]